MGNMSPPLKSSTDDCEVICTVEYHKEIVETLYVAHKLVSKKNGCLSQTQGEPSLVSISFGIEKKPVAKAISPLQARRHNKAAASLYNKYLNSVRVVINYSQASPFSVLPLLQVTSIFR